MVIREIALMAMTYCSIYAQGTLLFKNSFLNDPDTGQVYHAFAYNAAGTLLGPEFSASLYVVSAGSESLLVTVPFRSTSRGRLNESYVEVPGVPAGQSATFTVKVWETAGGSYETALQNGFCVGIFPTVSGNNQVAVTLTGRPVPGAIPDAQLNGLLPVTLNCIPEPSISALILLGAFLVFRRRSSTQP
jgi:hypothetical protein